MLSMEPIPVALGLTIENPREDYRRATRAGQHRISPNAFYFPAFPATKYVPCQALTAAILRIAALPTTGCCGKELPVLKLVLRWEGGQQEMIIDPPRHADTILEVLRTAWPDLEIDDRRG